MKNDFVQTEPNHVHSSEWGGGGGTAGKHVSLCCLFPVPGEVQTLLSYTFVIINFFFLLFSIWIRHAAARRRNGFSPRGRRDDTDADISIALSRRRDDVSDLAVMNISHSLANVFYPGTPRHAHNKYCTVSSTRDVFSIRFLSAHARRKFTKLYPRASIIFTPSPPPPSRAE